MAVTLTVRPLDAQTRLLPTTGRVALQSNGAALGDVPCGAGQAVSFTALTMHRVYAATVTAAGFSRSTKVMPVAASDRTEGILCFLAPKQTVADFPAFQELDRSLQAVLARSARLDRRQTERSVQDRALPERQPVANWPDPDRSSEERTGPERRDGERRWAALSPLQRAALLNLFAKMSSVVVIDRRTVWEHVIELDHIEQDRVIAVVESTLAPKARATLRFKEADDSLHQPELGFTRAGSVKTEEPYGNLQLTFSTDGSLVMVDADVDEAAGVEHAEQVARNWINSGIRKVLKGIIDDLPEGKTHPYDVHQILVFHQRGEDRALPTIRPYRAVYQLRLKDGPPGYAIG